jgi:UDPglucose 6-dehydrogenase
MSLPVIGFAGMTHLGLVSGVSASEKGFSLVCFDPNADRISALINGVLPVTEPNLNELVAKNASRLRFTSEPADLKSCDVIYIAPDVDTDDQGQSDLQTINSLLDVVFDVARAEAVIVVLSQVPPGFTRQRQRSGRQLFYQVETLVFGRAVERALYPERYIIGCADPGSSIPDAYLIFLQAHGCPVLPMRYESAELAKISINMCLVASVTVANTMAEICEKIGADWSEIVPALKLDRRIGEYSYLSPGLGIAGGNLERDLATVCNFADKYETDAGVVRAWLANSVHRKSWPISVLGNTVFNNNPDPVIGIWGLAYKENTNSTKNSPALSVIKQLQHVRLKVYDPLVKWNPHWHPTASLSINALHAVKELDALLILTPWPEFKSIPVEEIKKAMKGKLVIDPYGMLPESDCTEAGLIVHRLGRAIVA